MISKDTKIPVTNRDNGTTFYVTQTDTGATVKRVFNAFQTLEIPFGELQALYWSKGGKVMLEELLRIDNEQALKEIIGEVEPEYNYSEQDIKQLLLKGSLDELKDCLDFAPISVVDLVRDLAVTLEIDSEAKRQAITEATGFDVTGAIKINRQVREAEKDATSVDNGDMRKTGERRVQPATAEKAEGRRTTPPKYTPVGK